MAKEKFQVQYFDLKTVLCVSEISPFTLCISQRMLLEYRLMIQFSFQHGSHSHKCQYECNDIIPSAYTHPPIY